MKVVLERTDTTDGRAIGTLTVGKTYEVIGIEANDYRIVDEEGEPIIFDRSCFDVVESAEPAFWVSIIVDGVRYVYPPDWMRPGFFEDYFDYKEDVRREFWSLYRRYFGGKPKKVVVCNRHTPEEQQRQNPYASPMGCEETSANAPKCGAIALARTAFALALVGNCRIPVIVLLYHTGLLAKWLWAPTAALAALCILGLVLGLVSVAVRAPPLSWWAVLLGLMRGITLMDFLGAVAFTG